MGENAQAVIQVLAEAAFPHILLQVSIGRCDDTHIHLTCLLLADALILALLQHAQ